MSYLILFSIHPILFFEFTFFDIKDKEICDPMEKIWVKKELYFRRYWFMNFMDFLEFFFNLIILRSRHVHKWEPLIA